MNPDEHKRVRTVAEHEAFVPLDDLNNFQPENWKVYNASSTSLTAAPASTVVSRKDLEWRDSRPPRRGFEVVWRLLPLLHPQATGFAVAKKFFGEGAERLVFKMTEVDSAGRPVGVPLVAKENLYMLDSKMERKRERDNAAWHRIFVKTQMKAAKIAGKMLIWVTVHPPLVFCSLRRNDDDVI
jgi:hypothetical protein